MSETMTASYTNDSSCASPAPSEHSRLSWGLGDPPASCETYVSPSRSDRFWFQDGSVVLKVDNTLYNVYRGILTQQSSFFRSKLAAISFTKPLAGKKKGWASLIAGCGSSQNPLSLDVVKAEFETLLSYMHPTDYESQYKLTIKEWSAIVNVSAKLELTSIRAAAIANILRSADALDLIDIGRKYAIPECYIEGFHFLCHRVKSLSLEEGKSLGMEPVIIIAHARDMLAKGEAWTDVECEISDQFEHETTIATL